MFEEPNEEHQPRLTSSGLELGRQIEVDVVASRGLLRDKATGLELTHPDVSALMVRLATRDGFTPETVLDPAAGFGNFLFESAFQVPAVRELTGYEPASDAAAIARDRLAPFTDRGVAVNVLEDDALSALIPRDYYDLVICNPPYVRIHRLGNDRNRLRERYVTAAGRFDLYFLFFELAARSLAVGGRLAFISSNKYMTTNAGRALRYLLTTSFAPLRIIDFRDASPFRAAVLSAVVVMEKGRRYVPGSANAVELNRSLNGNGKAEALSELADDPVPSAVTVPRLGAQPVTAYVSSRPIDSWVASTATWHLGRGSDVTLLDLLTFGNPRLADLFPRLSVGIKTTADDVFIHPFKSPDSVDVEAELLHPLIRGGSIARWRTTWAPENGYDRYVLYPHKRAPNGRTSAVELKDYPRAAAYLDSHRSRLESRAYVRDAGREWFEIWVPQRVDVMTAPRKLVFPDFAVRNTFAIEWSGAFVGSSAAFAIPSTSLTNDDLWYVLFLLNSPLFEFIHQRFLGTSILSKRHRYWTRHVAAYPIPWPNAETRLGLAREARDAAESGEDPTDHLDKALGAFDLERDARARLIGAVKDWIKEWAG